MDFKDITERAEKVIALTGTCDCKWGEQHNCDWWHALRKLEVRFSNPYHVLHLIELFKASDDLAYQIEKYEDVIGFSKKAPLASLKNFKELREVYTP